jgi:hypothetical protein
MLWMADIVWGICAPTKVFPIRESKFRVYVRQTGEQSERRILDKILYKVDSSDIPQ